MEDFVIKRFIKGVIILVLSGLLIGVGRGISDTIQFLNQPRNVYNADTIQVGLSPSDLAHSNFNNADMTSSFSYQLTDDTIGSIMPFYYFLFDDEKKQMVDNISGSSGHVFKWIQIGSQLLPISKIQFTLTAESDAKVKVYLVNDFSYLYGIPEDGQAVVYEFDRTDTTYEVEIPRLFANNQNQWTYASFHSVVIALEDNTPFTLSDMKFIIPLQRTPYNDTDTLIQ